MNNPIRLKCILAGIAAALLATSCIPTHAPLQTSRPLPQAFMGNAATQDTTNTGLLAPNQFFADPNLISLIDTALAHNQELKIAEQEALIARFEIQARKGEYLPSVRGAAGASMEKTPRYTRNGVVEEHLEVEPGQRFPEPYTNQSIGLDLSWEVDIWGKLRNAKKAAAQRYYASREGRQLIATLLVAEIANSYYELMALDNELLILQRNISLQEEVLGVVRQQKQAARVNELAVRRFEAELMRNQSRLFFTKQQIIETENRINQLAGRYPQPVIRSSTSFTTLVPPSISTGVPAQLLANRPDVRQAEYLLQAAQIDVKVTRANFLPAMAIDGRLGYEAFNPAHLFLSPQSIGLGLAGGLVAPVINRNGIVAAYNTANAHQVQRIYEYEQTLIRAYTEVNTQMSSIVNLNQAYERKYQQVQTLADGIRISQALFRNARADYTEVLLTQRDYLEANVELIELKALQMQAVVNAYRALGGGWR
ncbi:MAG: efflux transporter outer membrane subunit [Bacteroidetes bacterium]|nr:efflux transporter outer membrane subunit [Bacteroidota bacterium]